MFQSAVYPVSTTPTSGRDALSTRLDIGLAAMARTDGLAVAPVPYDVHAVAVLRLLGPLAGAMVDDVLEEVQRRAVRLGAAEDGRLDRR
jgi:hypothetical protein